MCAKFKAHTTPDAVRAGIISADDQAGNDLADAAGKLMVNIAPCSVIRAARRSANLAVTCMAHWIARLGCAKQRLDIDAVWIPGRSRRNSRRHECARPWASNDVGTILLKVSLGACARPVSILSVRRVEDVCVRRAPARDAAFSSALTTRRGTESSISCKEATSPCSALCAAPAVLAWLGSLCSVDALVLRLLDVGLPAWVHAHCKAG